MEEELLLKSPSFIYELTFTGKRFPATNDFVSYYVNFENHKDADVFIFECLSSICNYFKTIDHGRDMFYQFVEWLRNDDALALSYPFIQLAVKEFPEDFHTRYFMEYSISKKSCYLHSDILQLHTLYLFLIKFISDITETNLFNRQQLFIYYKNVITRDAFPGFFKE